MGRQYSPDSAAYCPICTNLGLDITQPEFAAR
jgi:hypothetical protein